MSYQQILVPFDGSPLARAALSIGAWLAWRTNAKLRLFRAAPASAVPFTPRSPRVASMMVEAQAAERAEAQSALRLEVDKLVSLGVDADGTAEMGEAGPAILRWAADSQADLIVMGTHGRPLHQRWLLGSVANEVARKAPAPVLLVPRETTFQREERLRVLVALDGSDASEAALHATMELAKAVPATLTLFRVTPTNSDGDQTAQSDTAHYLVRTQEQVAGAGLACDWHASMGEPAAEILAFAEREAFDVVAIATRGRGGIARAVMGSVAERVVEHAGNPVLMTNRKSQKGS